MTKKGFLKVVVFLALFVGLAAGVSAQITISGGFALATMSAKFIEDDYTETEKGKVGAGGNIYFDYLLPISVPLSLGAEVGYDTAKVGESQFAIRAAAIPILLRAAYHFDLASKLDLYLVGKIGYAFGFSDDYEGSYSGVGFGFDLGIAYYFGSHFGIFAEGGFDRYNLSSDVTGTESYFDGKKWQDYDYAYTIKVPFSRFATFGVSLKF
ncbi:hypothetical protein FACS1894137_10270 [Spirochaetia bacterium]|nr:hypothetical protein FACS1894137_10270 [Spirochaetia bacterium]